MTIEFYHKCDKCGVIIEEKTLVEIKWPDGDKQTLCPKCDRNMFGNSLMEDE